jgi:hypothetical protein
MTVREIGELTGMSPQRISQIARAADHDLPFEIKPPSGEDEKPA